MPNSPSSFILATRSARYSSAWSYSLAMGMISLRQNVRTSSTISARTSSLATSGGALVAVGGGDEVSVIGVSIEQQGSWPGHVNGLTWASGRLRPQPRRRRSALDTVCPHDEHADNILVGAGERSGGRAPSLEPRVRVDGSRRTLRG